MKKNFRCKICDKVVTRIGRLRHLVTHNINLGRASPRYTPHYGDYFEHLER